MNRAEQLVSLLKQHAAHNPYDSTRFFKIAPGEYAHHDLFLGLRMPYLRTIAQEHRNLDQATLRVLLDNPYHEIRLLALLVLTYQFEKADEQTQTAIFQFYVSQMKQINNWDLVDVSAPTIVGGYLLNRPHDMLFAWGQSDDLWQRRIAMVSTLFFIRNHQLDTTFALAKLLLADKHDLMHKATGWMLREAGKKDESRLIQFLTEHAAVMPRTMLRYSIERLDKHAQQRFMSHRQFKR